MRGPTGHYEVTSTAGEEVRAFVPDPLPPRDLVLTTSDHVLLEMANRALGRLDGFARLLPEPGLFVYGYVRREAVLSSQIEGTQSTLNELLAFENDQAPGVPVSNDVLEVSNYVQAMEYGLERLSSLPLSIRLLREIHGHLLKSSRGGDKAPGEIRRSQNWIGGSRPGNAAYVPPPPHLVMNCLGALELFLQNQPEPYPTLMKAALSHVQFETIHPFLDGNGRLGRLLITFLLVHESALTQPLLYLSLYFKTHKQEYYSLLQAVRTEGRWEDWLRFFLRGVSEVSDSAVTKANRILDLFRADRLMIEAKLGRKAGSALRVQEQMQRTPFVKIPNLATTLNVSKPTIAAAIEELEALALVKQLGDQKRGRTFYYVEYLKILNEDM
ncbi:MAG TPA: Fic family protein [Kofleriaceae bacterium]|nr:Fic family protein [Kofleriaceae bacterium]